MELTTRNATLEDLSALLTEQHTRKLDLVVPARKLTARGGLLVVDGAEPIVDESGVTPCDGVYRPTSTCDEGIADKLGIPLAYLRKLRADRPDLYDANLNGWLHGHPMPDLAGEGSPVETDADPRSFMLRSFRGDDGGEGIARAFLSDRYGIIDHLDVLVAAMEGVRDSGVEIEVKGCDLSERRMYVRIAAPSVATVAPMLLANYRSPFNGRTATECPLVFAGFVLSNSETGHGSATLTPRIVLQVCDNGMTITRDAMRSIHLGGRLEEGAVRWSEDTQRKALELVTAKARDAVATFLDVGYLQRIVERLDVHGDAPLSSPSETVETVCNKLGFSDQRRTSVLDHFIRGGAATVGGVMNAVTSVAQEIADPDDAAEMESAAFRAFDLALAEA